LASSWFTVNSRKRAWPSRDITGSADITPDPDRADIVYRSDSWSEPEYEHQLNLKSEIWNCQATQKLQLRHKLKCSNAGKYEIARWFLEYACACAHVYVCLNYYICILLVCGLALLPELEPATGYQAQAKGYQNMWMTDTSKLRTYITEELARQSSEPQERKALA
jgi:hypothetical protein